jgi:hypothetical protein
MDAIEDPMPSTARDGKHDWTSDLAVAGPARVRLMAA